ncbi:hypothetical protein AB1K18_27995 [Peribacillus simplex]
MDILQKERAVYSGGGLRRGSSSVEYAANPETQRENKQDSPG